jgi:hypothetical protein
MKTSDIIEEELWAGWIMPVADTGVEPSESAMEALSEPETDDSLDECCF